jgi:hypothetical protein
VLQIGEYFLVSWEAQMNETKRDEYLTHFPHDKTPTSIRNQALIEARENRKFEIDLYWKRAGYFWVFIALTFGGYATLQTRPVLAFLTACSGFVFSLAWYFVNRGSKQWQENWELHVDLLEDDVAGPIYKTVVQRSPTCFYKLNEPYPFSVSKINQLLSLYVTIVWLALIGRMFAIVWGISVDMLPRLTIAAISVFALFTLATAIGLARFGRTREAGGNVKVNVDENFYQRTRTFK